MEFTDDELMAIQFWLEFSGGADDVNEDARASAQKKVEDELRRRGVSYAPEPVDMLMYRRPDRPN